MPATFVFTVGVTREPVPPVAVVYHKILRPTATGGMYGKYWQYVLVPVMAGGGGVGNTVTVIESRILSQPRIVCDAQNV